MNSQQNIKSVFVSISSEALTVISISVAYVYRTYLVLLL
jgi:hypothetical protein